MFRLYEQPLQARPSLIFPFLPFFCPPVLSPAWMGWLSPIPFRRCPGFAHNWPTRLQQGWSGASLVSFLYPVLKLTKNRRTGASLDFLPRTSLPLPLKGEGPGIVCLGFVGFAPLGHSCLTRLQQGRFGGWLVFASLLSFQNRTQGHTSPSLVLTVFSSCLFAQAEPPNPAPACNSPPPGWGGSCKEDSHFAPSLPLFLPSWAPCRSVASLPTAVCILQPC